MQGNPFIGKNLKKIICLNKSNFLAIKVSQNQTVKLLSSKYGSVKRFRRSNLNERNDFLARIIGNNASGGSLPKPQGSLSELTFVQGSSHSKSQTNVTNRSTDRPKTDEVPKL